VVIWVTKIMDSSDDSHIWCQAQGLARLSWKMETHASKIREQKKKSRRLRVVVEEGLEQLEADLQSLKEDMEAQCEEEARQRNIQSEVI